MTRRFTDRHVVENPDLTIAAMRYLEWYTGQFEFLVSAQQALDSDRQLSASTIRGVLNCMLADSNVQGLVVPPFKAFAANRSVDPICPEFSVNVPVQGKVYWPLGRRGVRMKTNWKKTFGISMRPQACLVHVVDTDTSQLVMWQGGDLPVRPIWELNWLCSPYLYFNGRQDGFLWDSRYRLLSQWEANDLIDFGTPIRPRLMLPPRKWKWCRKCEDENDRRSSRSARRPTS